MSELCFLSKEVINHLLITKKIHHYFPLLIINAWTHHSLRKQVQKVKDCNNDVPEANNRCCYFQQVVNLETKTPNAQVGPKKDTASGASGRHIWGVTVKKAASSFQQVVNLETKTPNAQVGPKKDTASGASGRHIWGVTVKKAASVKVRVHLALWIYEWAYSPKSFPARRSLVSWPWALISVNEPSRSRPSSENETVNSYLL